MQQEVPAIQYKIQSSKTGPKCTCPLFEQYVNYRRIEFHTFVAYP